MSKLVIPGVIAQSGSGGGSTVTVDDALSDTSENPVQNKVVTTALNKKLENKATGENALSVLGPAVPAPGAVLIGYDITGQYCTYSVAIGYLAKVGNSANAIAIGYDTFASERAIAIGGSAYALSSYAIQIGQGSNTSSKTLQVYTFKLLDGNTGLIPPERLGTGYDATKTQVLKHINGVATWVDEA